MNDNSSKPPKRGPGRPSKLPNVAELEGAAARIRSQDRIAHACGMAPSTLYKYKRQYAEFTEAIENGRAKLEFLVGDALVAGALQGEFAKQAFYLERFCGWTKPCDSEPPSAAIHRGLSSDLVAVLRESLLGELQRQQPVLIEGGDAHAEQSGVNNARAAGLTAGGSSMTTTAITVVDKRAELLGRNGHGNGSDE